MTFVPDEVMPVLLLPEGMLRPGLFSQILGLSEPIYDPLWKYIAKVNSSVYSKIDQPGEIKNSGVKLMTEGGIPAFVDFKAETLFVGRKITVPFSNVTGLVVAVGLLPGREIPAMDLLARFNGCSQYLPLHRFSNGGEVMCLSTKLQLEMFSPLGLYIKPFHIALEPGSQHLLYEDGRIRLEKLRGILVSKSKDGRTSVNLLHEGGRKLLVFADDPDGNLEQLGLLADELLAAAMKKTARTGSLLHGLAR